MNKRSGFSLIELVLAFGILAMLATTSTVILTATLRSSARAAVSGKVRNEGEYIMENIFQMVRYAHGVTCRTVGGFDILEMAKINPADATGPKFSCKDGFMASNSGVLLNPDERLNSSDVRVEPCNFTCAPSMNPTQVNVFFGVRDVDGLIDPLIFDTNIILRNTR